MSFWNMFERALENVGDQLFRDVMVNAEKYAEKYAEQFYEEHKEVLEQEMERRLTPCDFDETVSWEEFESLAIKATRKFKRIEKTDINGPLVSCTVRSQQGLSTWDFTIDFNDYGHITGKCWIRRENTDSTIPDKVANIMMEAIAELIQKKQMKDNPRSVMFKCENCGQKLTVPSVVGKARATCPICHHEQII